MNSAGVFDENMPGFDQNFGAFGVWSFSGIPPPENGGDGGVDDAGANHSHSH